MEKFADWIQNENITYDTLRYVLEKCRSFIDERPGRFNSERKKKLLELCKIETVGDFAAEIFVNILTDPEPLPSSPQQKKPRNDPQQFNAVSGESSDVIVEGSGSNTSENNSGDAGGSDIPNTEIDDSGHIASNEPSSQLVNVNRNSLFSQRQNGFQKRRFTVTLKRKAAGCVVLIIMLAAIKRCSSISTPGEMSLPQAEGDTYTTINIVTINNFNYSDPEEAISTAVMVDYPDFPPPPPLEIIQEEVYEHPPVPAYTHPPVPPLDNERNLFLVSGVREAGLDESYGKEVALNSDSRVADVSFSVRNTSGLPLHIGIVASLPEGLRLVEGSAKLYNSLNAGAPLGDIQRWSDLGLYRVYDAVEGYGSLTVTYQVEVDADFYDVGWRDFIITNSVVGFDSDGNQVTNLTGYAVHVLFDFGD